MPAVFLCPGLFCELHVVFCVGRECALCLTDVGRLPSVNFIEKIVQYV